MIENGKIERIKNKWYGKHNLNYEMEEAVQLGYEHVLFPYSWLALGIMMGVAVIGAELMSKRLAKTRPMKAITPPSAASVPGNSKDEINIEQLLNEHEMLTASVKKLEARNKALDKERNSLKEQLRLSLPQVS